MPTHFGLDTIPKTYPAIARPEARVPLASKLELSKPSQAKRKKTQPNLGYYYNRGGASNFAGMSGMRYRAAQAAPEPVDSQMPFKEAASAAHKFKHISQKERKPQKFDIQKNIDTQETPKSFNRIIG